MRIPGTLVAIGLNGPRVSAAESGSRSRLSMWLQPRYCSTRLRLLHALIRAEEMCVTDLADTLGMKPQALSNQLQRLSDLGILSSRREGNNIFYRVVDLCVFGLLEQGWCLMEQADGRTGVT